MRCHYDVLSVGRDATDDEIKKSYRKLALQYHPDKNPDNPEVVELFREVQSAYDVLSDRQERAWYDKHREAILKGGDDYVDDALDLMHYFNPSVYSGFDDGSKGFYTVFRDAFCRLSKEDEPYMDEDEVSEVVPEFGFSHSDYESVVKPFYVYWLAYRTKKSFVWKQMYDTRQAANRPTQRLMEKENKKLRESSRKKRNEEVRALVMYVRKRDKRVQEEVTKMKLKQEEAQRKTKEIQEMQKLDRSKMLENYEEQEWMAFDDSKLDDIDSQFDHMFGRVTNQDSDESDQEDFLYCIACDKNFKSEKALENHEKSKKHKENVVLIKNALEADLFEELHISNEKDGDDEHKIIDIITEDCDSADIDDNNFLPRVSSMNLPANVVKRNVLEKNTKSGEDYTVASSKKSKKKKKKKRGNGLIFDIMENSDDEPNGSDASQEEKQFLEDFENGDKDTLINEDMPCESAPNTTRDGSDASQEEKHLLEDFENDDKDTLINEDKPCESVPNTTQDGNANSSCCEEEEISSSSKEINMENKSDDIETDTCSAKTNNNTDNVSNKKNEKKSNDDDEPTGSFTCDVCPKIFPTRNKLFKHIKAEGHAVLKEGTKKSKKGKKGKK